MLDSFKIVDRRIIYSPIKSRSHLGEERITYERCLGKIERLRLGLFAILASIFIIPRCIFIDHVEKWWDQAWNGVERKIVRVPLPFKSIQSKKVHFQDHVTICHYFVEEEPIAIHDTTLTAVPLKKERL